MDDIRLEIPNESVEPRDDWGALGAQVDTAVGQARRGIRRRLVAGDMNLQPQCVHRDGELFHVRRIHGAEQEEPKRTTCRTPAGSRGRSNHLSRLSPLPAEFAGLAKYSREDTGEPASREPLHCLFFR